MINDYLLIRFLLPVYGVKQVYTIYRLYFAYSEVNQSNKLNTINISHIQNVYEDIYKLTSKIGSKNLKQNYSKVHKALYLY